jgi:hypothetical protein
MWQVEADVRLIRQKKAAAQAQRNHVDAFFYDCLLFALLDLVPGALNPEGAGDPRAVVVTEVAEAGPSQEAEEAQAFVENASRLVEALRVRASSAAAWALPVASVGCCQLQYVQRHGVHGRRDRSGRRRLGALCKHLRVYVILHASATPLATPTWTLRLVISSASCTPLATFEPAAA